MKQLIVLEFQFIRRVYSFISDTYGLLSPVCGYLYRIRYIRILKYMCNVIRLFRNSSSGNETS